MLNWAVLMLLGASLATTFEGLIVSLLSFAQSTKNGIPPLSRYGMPIALLLIMTLDRALLIGMNSVIVSIWGTLGTKTSATIFHSVMSKILRTEIGDDDLAQEVGYLSVVLSRRQITPLVSYALCASSR